MILADNTNFVQEGQPLIEINRHDFEIALQMAKANLAESVREVCSLFIQVEELKAKKQSAQANLLKAKREFEHRKMLVEDKSVSLENFEHSQTTLSSALGQVKQVEKELAMAIAKVTNTTIENHPLIEKAKSALRSSFLSLNRCTVRSPVSGIITLRKAQVGQWVAPSTPLLSVVPLDQIWVDANFREVSLKNLRVGQQVELYSDMYGKRQKFHGKIIGLNPGTGSVFSILPPQNATGNWIKIVQRVPVKISLDSKELERNPLVLGLSMTVTAETKNRIGPQLPELSAPATLYATSTYKDELLGADEIIESILRENMYTVTE